MLDRLDHKRFRSQAAFQAGEAKRKAAATTTQLRDLELDRYSKMKQGPVAREDIPRSNVADKKPASLSDGLAAYLGAHPVFSATTAATLGVLSIAGGTMGATLDTTVPAELTNTNVNAAAARDRSIVFVGMNEGSRHEVQNLINATGSQNSVTYIKSSARADVVKIQNVEYDLSTTEGRDAFAAKLGLRGDRATALAKVLEDTSQGARDELGQLAKVFSEAERGQRYIERLVLSGHSVGSGVWGDGNGSLSFSQITKLTAVFPRAAAQVQDLMLAACYTGGEETMDQYRVMFPNVKTIWGYDGSAPGSYSGAVPHITRWERGTRGEGSDNLRRESATHTRKGENVAVWTATRGYSNGQPPRALADVQAQYEQSRAVLAQFQSGEQQVDNPGEGPLRQHYNNVQRLLSRRDLPQADRAQLEAERDLVIRLIYYKNASGIFQTTHRSTIENGFRELGMNIPDFSRLTRKEALEVIAQFDAKLAQAANPSRTLNYLAEILHGGLRDLGPQYIPNAWL